MRIQWKKLIISILIPLGVGALSALLTMGGMRDFDAVQPPLSPPAWLFPIVWTVLYTLMGVACYLVWLSKRRVDNALFAYGIQLIFNFFWSILFFGIKNYLIAFLWLLALLAAIIWNTVLFYRTEKTAGLLLIPYIVWVTFAGYLNLGIYLLN